MHEPSINHPKLAALHTYCLNSSSSFVSFKLPLEQEINTYVQYKSTPSKLHSLENISSIEGFIFSPFTLNKNNSAFLLQPAYSFTNNNLPDDIFEIIRKGTTKKNKIENHTNDTYSTTSKEEFEVSITKALEAIESGTFQKVVISKTQLIEKPVDFSEVAFFQTLCQQYPHAFVYFISIGPDCCWMGASPEPLLTSNRKTMQTVSLAGTQPATDKPIESYQWSEKELEEQEIVTRFIERTLLDNGINEYQKSKTENYKAANLIHLKSCFEFPMSNSKPLLSSLITALHPTPSVGGLPRLNAIDFIVQTEKHNRAFYTGFLGTLHQGKHIQLYVNLRCMQLLPTSILLYSGAGITNASKPEKEWMETENKLQTLKQVIFSPKY